MPTDMPAHMRLLTTIRDDDTTDAEQAEALLAWMAESDEAPAILGMLWGLAAHLVAQGRPIVRQTLRHDISPTLLATLATAARHDWDFSTDRWRRAQAAEWLLGPATPRRNVV